VVHCAFLPLTRAIPQPTAGTCRYTYGATRHRAVHFRRSLPTPAPLHNRRVLRTLAYADDASWRCAIPKHRCIPYSSVKQITPTTAFTNLAPLVSLYHCHYLPQMLPRHDAPILAALRTVRLNTAKAPHNSHAPLQNTATLESLPLPRVCDMYGIDIKAGLVAHSPRIPLRKPLSTGAKVWAKPYGAHTTCRLLAVSPSAVLTGRLPVWHLPTAQR